jgi:hypothetical protein
MAKNNADIVSTFSSGSSTSSTPAKYSEMKRPTKTGYPRPESVTFSLLTEPTFPYWTSDAGYREATTGMGDTGKRGDTPPTDMADKQTLIDKWYRAAMLVAMILELLLLGYIAWKA